MKPDEEKKAPEAETPKPDEALPDEALEGASGGQCPPMATIPNGEH
ncbi:MAG: hypothetical protein IK082_06540 [Oscillospiraceae bacterium]|nr:hypothetical protein [Oscillospiraceae bacterium]